MFGIDPLYSLSGFVVGVVVGLTGVGGGSLMTPLLILLFNIHPATAVGTDLLYAALTKSAGTFMHGRNRNVDWKVVGTLALGSVAASALTLWGLASLGGSSPEVTRLISQVLGGMLVLTALTLFFRRWLVRFAHDHREPNPRLQAILTVAVGAGIGVLVSISSVGAGAIGVVALMLLYPRMPILKVVATDVAHAVPLTAVAGLGHWAIGNVDLGMLASLIVGSIPGILLASWFSPKVPEAVLRVMLGVVLTVVGVKLVSG
ncbi:MAG TPA: sulfite exporter TauE/SafE family protein [Devosia sp.]